jgi:4-hydroxy-2-oxoglutarate aldolase
MAFIKIKGVLPPMVTPFDENDKVDYDKHVRNIEKWNEYDLAGYLVLGSNSETVYLTEEEKLKLIELTVKHKKPGKLVVAGTGMESTSATIDLTNKAADLGADCALIVTPFYYGGKMNDEALINFYTEVADNTRIPVMIYNVTKFTHVNISPKAVGVLCKHPNIIGMKDSSGNVSQLIDFKAAIGNEEFNLMIGTASIWYPALTLGVEGSVMALANCCPGECVDVQKEFETGNLEKARALYERVFPVNSAVTGKYGIAGLKYACDLLGFEGGYVRKPLVQLKEQEKSELVEILKKAKVLN